jgi:hypothetical protein
MKKKVIVYDHSGGFSKFLRIYFNNQFEAVSFHSFFNRKEIKLKEYDVAFFIINDPIDLTDLLWFNSKIYPLFVGSNKSEMMKNLIGIENIIIIDLFQKKNEIIEFINSQLNMLNINIETY